MFLAPQTLARQPEGVNIINIKLVQSALQTSQDLSLSPSPEVRFPEEKTALSMEKWETNQMNLVTVVYVVYFGYWRNT